MLRFVGPFTRFGLLLAGAVLVLDQTSKLFVLHGLELRPGDARAVAPFFDLMLTFNRGISYGLWPQESDFGRNLLVVLSLAAAFFFVMWLARTPSRLVATALGLLIGGAIGNAVDRALYGAVVDFVSLHAFGWRWYVFNVADAAIVAGVVGLLYDGLVGATKTPPSRGT
jgi:signal peptidase II